jgi:nitrite reductase/ring-hydroxylating ferredoxin subunit
MAHDPQSRFEEDLTLDPLVGSPGREGLTGTARAGLYDEERDPEEVTVAPDHRPMSEQPEWRRDFPIDWPVDQLVARRSFAGFLVLTSGGFVVGQGWIAAQDLIRKGRPPPPRRKIASLGDVPVGAALMFNYPGDHDPCLLLRPDESTLVAYSQSCTHLACAVVPKMEEGVLHCPCHAGYFDLRTGKNIAGPPPRPLRKIELEIQGEDVLAVGVEERMA